MPSRKKSSKGVPLNGLPAADLSGASPLPRLTVRAFVSLRTTTTLGVACPAAWRKAFERALACFIASTVLGSSSAQATVLNGIMLDSTAIPIASNAQTKAPRGARWSAKCIEKPAFPVSKLV